MKLGNFKIGSQLLAGFALLLIFVILLGILSYRQTQRLHDQMGMIYNHPLQVRRALGHLNTEIMKIRMGTRDLLLASDHADEEKAMQSIAVARAHVMEQFAVLRQRSLGPQQNIDNAYNAFLEWETAREERHKLARSGKIEEARKNLFASNSIGILRNRMLASIQKIDNFSKDKGDSLYDTSKKLQSSLNMQLLAFICIILMFSILITYILLRNIRNPLIELTEAAIRFRGGDMTARSSYKSENELGVLSSSFNDLAESIQSNINMGKKISEISKIMFSEDDSRKFFKVTLSSILSHTDSQMAAVYLLNDDGKTYDYFESVGLSESMRKSFNAYGLEGEFGAALSSREIRHVKDIPSDTKFVFHTVNGNFVPREIITIPILSENEIIAIISTASIKKYSEESLELIRNIADALNARIERILAYRKIRKFSEKLEKQNRELEMQKQELASQSDELKTQNVELEMQKKQLGEVNRLKTIFLSNMSHELRTPLNSVIALSGVLSRRLTKKISDEEYSYIEVIERNGRHLLSLINDILDISRIEAGREDVETMEFNINDVIRDVVTMILPQAEHKNIQLLHSDSDTRLNIFSDSEKCRHILQNLISNAVKFTEYGKVEIKTEPTGENIEISVTDTGIGIPENYLPHIFDEFRQADGSTSRKFGGTGLGLAIAKKYAGLLGGNIRVKSIEGKGSEFILILPLKYSGETELTEQEINDHFPPTTELPETTTQEDHSSKTILLVEDSEPAIIQIRDFLEEKGYVVNVARGGNEALEAVKNNIPDGIILDLMMPGIDGFEVLRNLRETKQTLHTPVLILTAKHITRSELSFLKRNHIHQLIRKGDIKQNELLKIVKSMVYDNTSEQTAPQVKHTPPDREKPEILVVEDNPDNMITVKALLADDYTIIEAVDGNEGVEKAEKYKPDLILMDIALPGIDGIEAFRIIRNNIRLERIPVIALTASAMASERESILAHGFDAYIPKPIDEKFFFKTIKEVLYGK